MTESWLGRELAYNDELFIVFCAGQSKRSFLLLFESCTPQPLMQRIISPHSLRSHIPML